jgi:hypothetical protein
MNGSLLIERLLVVITQDMEWLVLAHYRETFELIVCDR